MNFTSSGPLGEPLGGHFGRLWGLLDRLRVIFASLGALSGRLGASLASLGPSWRYLRLSLGPLGGLWSRPGPKKPPTWPPEGVLERFAPPAPPPGPPPIWAKALCRTSLASALSVTFGRVRGENARTHKSLKSLKENQ